MPKIHTATEVNGLAELEIYQLFKVTIGKGC